jgi:hypothetical protein
MRFRGEGDGERWERESEREEELELEEEEEEEEDDEEEGGKRHTSSTHPNTVTEPVVKCLFGLQTRNRVRRRAHGGEGALGECGERATVGFNNK